MDYHQEEFELENHALLMHCRDKWETGYKVHLEIPRPRYDEYLVVLDDGEDYRLHRYFIMGDDWTCIVDSDQAAIEDVFKWLGNPQVLNEIVKHYIRVEYDRDYYGGGYNGVGDFAFLSRKRINEVSVDRNVSWDLAIRLVFAEKTKLIPDNMIHYTVDENYNEDGELIDG